MFRKNIKKIIVVFLFFFLLFTLLNLTGFSKKIKNFFFSFSAPIQRSFWQAGKELSSFLSVFSQVGLIKEEVKNLNLENQELLSQIVSFSELEKENQVLREALEIELEKEAELILTRVMAKDIAEDVLLLNKGSQDGVREGLVVITSGKVLLGRIGEVYDKFSELILISHKESSVAAKIFEKEVDGLVKGQGGFKLSLDLIPREEDISEGDLVITSSLGGVYPVGLLVGRVKEVKRIDTDSFRKAEINPIFDINKLDYLLIVND